MSSQRLQKVLAQAGIASRRAAEHLITEGRVRVNGRIVRELGARANPDKDRVEVDGRRLVAQRHVYFLLHKPRGVVTTLDDPEGRKTVKDLLRNINERVFPVGRLDFQTSGALLLTNDGDLAQALLHPTRAVPKTYNAKLEGDVDAARIEQLREGVVLDDGHKTAPAEVSILRKDDKSTSLEITIAEGKNRQIHRMGEAIARTVMRLTRISFAGLTLEGLRAGQMRQLSPTEVTELKQTYVHKAKKRRPFKAYGDMELDEASPLFVEDGESDDIAALPAWPEPNSAPAKRGKAGARERTPRGHGRGADDRGNRRDQSATREVQATSFGRGADDRAAPDPRSARGSRNEQTTRYGRGADRGKRNYSGTRDSRDEQTTGYGRGPEEGAKRGPRQDRATGYGRGAEEGAKRGPRQDRATGYGRGADEEGAKRGPRQDRATGYGRGADEEGAKRGPRQDRGYGRGADEEGAKRGPRQDRATGYGRGAEEGAKRDPRGTRDSRDEQATRYGRGAKRGTRDSRDEQTTRYGRGAKRDDRSTRSSRDDRAKLDEPRTRRDPRDDRSKRGARDKQDEWQITSDDRAKADKRTASDQRSKGTWPDPRGKRDQRTAPDPRAKRDQRADYDQTEAQPRKYRGARTQPAKRTRSQSSATKRGPAPRKTRFKR